MATKLSHKCKVNIIPGRYSLWNYISDIPANLAKEPPFQVIQASGQGVYVRPAYDHETYHVAGGQKQDKLCLVVLGDRIDGVTSILVPRDLLTRI